MRFPTGGQDLITGFVAERVVDGLEVIEVEEEHRDPALLATLHGVIQDHPEGGAVRQVCEGVVKGLMGQLLFERLPFADVPGVEHQAPNRRHMQEVCDRHLSRDNRSHPHAADGTRC